MFARLGRWCHDRRWAVLGLWFGVMLVANAALQGAGGSEMRTEFTLPNVESERGLEVIEDDFGGSGAGNAGQIVFQADQGVDDPEIRRAMEQTFAEVREVEHVKAVQGPYLGDGVPPEVAARLDGNSDGLVDRLVSERGDIAYAEVEFPSDLNVEETPTITEAVQETLPTGVEGLRIELGSQFFAEFEAPTSEALGVAFAIFILILSFGSVLAMGLPIGVALAGIGVGLTTTMLLSTMFTISDMVQFLGPMIGLGVGIDYALFIVTRFRENLHRGHDVRESTVIALNTAGRAVLFAGTTVVISLVGMVVMGLGFVNGIAVGTALVVAATVVASLTLLPALLGFTGSRIETTRWRGLVAAALVAVGLVGAGLKFSPLLVGFPLAAVALALGFFVVALKREVPRRAQRPLDETMAYRWSRLIQRRPWTAALLGVVVLGVLALPLAGLRHGFSDTSNYPEDTSTRQAHELMVQGFGEGFNGPITLVGELPSGGLSQSQLQAITSRLGDVPGVAQVTPAQPSENGQSVMWLMFPETAPQDEETSQLVTQLRDDVLPSVQEASGLDVIATGTVPINVDFTDYLSARLPYFLAAVLGLSFVLLMVVFRSVLVPVKAVVMNLLSVGASYGVVVAVFQWGWLGSVFGIEGAPIEPFVPMMLFAIVFGLSMDYEVFLLSRVREEWDRTGDSHTSVADGLAATARVITAAALIMVFVFGSFILESDRVSKLMGLGLATAVLLDATVVRMLLVPATMELLGDRNWWLPRWLDRILPRVNVEGDTAAPADRDATTPREELEPV